MPDIHPDVTGGRESGTSGRDGAEFASLEAWRSIEREFALGDVPHCRAVSAPRAWHPELLERLARLYLGLGPEAPSPVESLHGDLFVAGETGSPPDIERCRNLIRDLALKPLNAPRRLGVVMAADQLLLPAANSLLKLAEEPPSHACVLFLMEGTNLLPTLRSRARFTVLCAPLSIEPREMPQDEKAWAEWMAGAKDVLAVGADLEGWTAWAQERKDPALADRLERLRLIAETEKLSAPMLCDLLILALREELPFEHLFDDFR